MGIIYDIMRIDSKPDLNLFLFLLGGNWRKYVEKEWQSRDHTYLGNCPPNMARRINKRGYRVSEIHSPSLLVVGTWNNSWLGSSRLALLESGAKRLRQIRRQSGERNKAWVADSCIIANRVQCLDLLQVPVARVRRDG